MQPHPGAIRAYAAAELPPKKLTFASAAKLVRAWLEYRLTA